MADNQKKIIVKVKLVQIKNSTERRVKSFIYKKIKRGTYDIIIAEECNFAGTWCHAYTISEQVINVIKSKLQRWFFVTPLRDIECFYTASKTSHALKELKEVFKVENEPIEVHK